VRLRVQFAVAQRQGVKAAQAAHDLVELAPGSPLLQQVQLKATDLFRAELRGRGLEVSGKLGDGGDRRLDGAGGVVAQAQVVNEALT
jgi:hypothetical protein